MRVNPGLNQDLKRSGRHRRWLLAIGLAVVPMLTLSALAETYRLANVDFIDSGNQTKVILHTGSIVPVQKIEVTKNRLILDIDQIEAEETIHTNFSGASNISHVIFQPLNKNKVRMIIKGESLGAPSIAFHNQNTALESDSALESRQLAMETSAALRTIQEDGIQPAVLREDTTEPIESIDAMESGVEAKEQQNKIQPALTGKEAFAVSGSDKMSLDAQTSGNVDPLVLPAVDTANTVNMGAFHDFFDGLAGGKYDSYIPFGLLGLLLGGLGIFIQHKFRKLTRREPDLEDLLMEQSEGKRVSFREMADAYRTKHTDKTTEQSSQAQPKTSARKAHAEDLIGLKALKQTEAPAPERKPIKSSLSQQEPTSKPAADNTKTLENLLSALQAANMPKAAPKKPPVAKKQAVNQYLNQQQASRKVPAKPAGGRPAPMQKSTGQPNIQNFQPEVIKRQPKPGISSPANPINHAPAVRKVSSSVTRPGNMPPASPARPSQIRSNHGQSGPLPGNPEVLNFLRNVADLMEKDGKTDIAKSIHRNLNAQNLGLT